MPCFRTVYPTPSTLLWLLVLLITPLVAMARPYDERLDFSLLLGSSTTHWVYNTTSRETQLRSLTASWSQYISPSFRGSLNVSYLDTSQATHPQAVGLNTAGDALGIDLQMQLLSSGRLKLALRFAYDYARTANYLEGQEIENNWVTASLMMDGIYTLSKDTRLLAGVGAVTVDGEERLNGDINKVTPFHEETSEAYYAGLRILTDPRGHIGLRWYGGHKTGLFLNFSRRY